MTLLRVTANKVAEKLIREMENMGLHRRGCELSQVEFEMLARRMRWSAWRKRWIYYLSKHSFILAWYDVESVMARFLRRVQRLYDADSRKRLDVESLYE